MVEISPIYENIWGCLFVGFAILENSHGSKRTSGKPNVRTYSRLLWFAYSIP